VVRGCAGKTKAEVPHRDRARAKSRYHVTRTIRLQACRTSYTAAAIMLKPSSLGLSTFGSRSKVCLSCQCQLFGSSSRRNASSTPPPPKVAAASSTNNDEKFTPKPLNRPLGLPTPPSPGQNTGVDLRTWKQRRDDFVNHEKHIERRKQLYDVSLYRSTIFTS